MFCSNCGKEIQDGTNFCAECGTQISGTASTPQQIVEDNEPVLVLKPVFIGWVTALSVLPIQLFMTVWAGGFFGGFSLAAIKALKLPIPIWFPFVFFACLAFFGIPYVAYAVKKKTYAKTKYRFFRKKLDYFEGFFTIEEKTIDYRNIIEVNLSKGIFQRKYGLGTIILSTPATGYSSRSAMSGIRIADIQNPDEVYAQVKELINKAKS